MNDQIKMNNKIENNTFSNTIFDDGTRFNGWIEMIFNLLRWYFTNRPIVVKAIGEVFLNDWHITLYYTVIYLVSIYFGRRLMENREPFNLRKVLAIWSALLCIFSIFGSLVAVPEFINILMDKGFVATYCDNSYIANQSAVFWYTLFSLSKIAELFDTAFIVLRKQKLITLHWIHHFLTLIYVFYIFGFYAATARWMVTMNLMVHSVMYGYYSLKALKINVPKWIAMSITITQIIQMFFGLGIHIHIIYKLYNNVQCHCPMRGTIVAFLMYLLYFYFFTKFFFNSYLNRSKMDQFKSYFNKINNDRLKKKLFPHMLDCNKNPNGYLKDYSILNEDDVNNNNFDGSKDDHHKSQ